MKTRIILSILVAGILTTFMACEPRTHQTRNLEHAPYNHSPEADSLPGNVDHNHNSH